MHFCLSSIQQQFQVYIRVSHSLEENRELANFNPPFTDPLIDDIFIEADVTAVLFDAQFVNSEMYTVTGDFGVATLTLALNVRCALNYFGSSCEMLCDSSGENCATGNNLIVYFSNTSYLSPIVWVLVVHGTYYCPLMINICTACLQFAHPLHQ